MNGARRKLFFKPHSEAFHMGKPLPPGVEISIKFLFNDSAFFMNGVGNNGRLTTGKLQMTCIT